ncbi:MFS transporter [Massilia sp. W12]|uniref:MFS transporter n=1 Tax=Massilia sp. W12 TaxID=3126507 RepID=UPI0030CAA437
MSLIPAHLSLAFTLFSLTAAVNVQAPLYAAYAARDGYGVLATTLAFSCYVLGVLPVLLTLGGLSDRIGRKPVMLLALALSASATVLMLLSPHIPSLMLARFLLGLGTALMSATATAYMIELLGQADSSRGANWVTASSSIGFGMGPAITSLCLLWQDSLRPLSFYAVLAALSACALLLWRLPATDLPGSGARAPMLRLPYFNRAVCWYGAAIFLCWASTGLVLSILPGVLAKQSMSQYAGLCSLLAISCGLLFQPMARKLPPQRATLLGLMILLPSVALLAWGALHGVLAAILIASFCASSACYGFVYLGGLAGVAHSAGAEKARASAAYFLLAYLGLSLPVMLTGLIADHFGIASAFYVFGLLLLGGTLALYASRQRMAAAPSQS